jgi:hypothetical protein
MRALATALAGLCLLATPAAAGTITGTITAQVGGGPLAGFQVRAWGLGQKGWTIVASTTTSGTGAYSLTVAGGNYKVDARMAPGITGNYGDRWYDVAAPLGNGYVGEYADILAVGASGTVGGVNIALEVLGGADGTVLRPGNVASANMFVRMERRAEPRIHHNDVSKALPAGLTSMRGLPPATDYQILIYDPAGLRDTRLLPGPYAITSGANASLGNLTMSDYGADPYENNNTPSCSAGGIDPTPFRQNPPQPWQSSNARIGPAGAGDVDWFCFPAVEGDRFFVTATTAFVFNGATRYHPWTDPLLSFWAGARGSKLAEDDDSGPGPFDARLDTGPLSAGCHCAAVTTFGDANYVGTGQGSTGRYTLRFEMGNRPPVVSIRKGATPVPPPPAALTLDEGDTLALVLGYPDADGDAVTASFTHVDSGDTPVAGGALVLGAIGGTYTWTPGVGAAAGSPYLLRLQAADAELQMARSVLVVVTTANRPPSTPVPVAPIGGAVVAEGTPALSWSNASDPDGDALTYDVELYYGDPESAPAQSAALAEASGGTTAWTPEAIPENTRAWWRVRARDGHVGGVSPWSDYGRFLVDRANDPPEAPILLKPADGELLAVRRPGLSVLNVVDPEDDEVGFVFEIARDGDFTDLVWTSDPVPMNLVAATTMTVTGVDLAWGGRFHARARARDARGAVSDWSNVRSFRLKDNLPPGTPDFAPACQVTVHDVEAPRAIVVHNVEDPEDEPVTFELEVFPLGADPQTAVPVYATRAPMDGDAATTAIPVDLSGLPNGHYRYRVRAFDGTDASAWIECELILELPDAPAGGCCGVGGAPAGAGLLALAVLGLARRRRRPGLSCR